MVRGVERTVGFADGGEQAVERADDGDRERRDEEVVAEAQRERDAVGGEHRQQRVGRGNLAQERNARARRRAWMSTVISAATAVPAARPMSFDGSDGQRLRTTTNTTIVTSADRAASSR